MPFSILTVVCATASVTIYDDWERLLTLQGYTPKARMWASVIVMLGHLGSFPGVPTQVFGHFPAFLIAAVLSILGYGGLGVCSTYDVGSNWHFFFTGLCMYLAAYGASIAVMAVVHETLNGFSKRGGLLYIVLIICYFLMGPSYEESLERGFASRSRLTYYYPWLGVGVAIIFIANAILAKLAVIEERFRRTTINEDIIGILVFILIVSLMTVLEYVFFFQNHSYVSYFIVFT